MLTRSSKNNAEISILSKKKHSIWNEYERIVIVILQVFDVCLDEEHNAHASHALVDRFLFFYLP